MYNILWPRMAAAAVRSKTVILILVVCVVAPTMSGGVSVCS